MKKRIETLDEFINENKLKEIKTNDRQTELIKVIPNLKKL